MKFTSYKYWLIEKFTQDSDPIHDMGIGIDIPRDFDNTMEASKWLVRHLPHILRTTEIPNDIIKDKNNYIKTKYSDIIDEYIAKYISINGEKNFLGSGMRIYMIC